VDSEFDILVAGGGIAGLSAGLSAARLGRKTLVLTGNVLGGHLLSIEKVEGYPGFPEGIAGYELCPITQAQAAEAGAEFAMCEVEGLEAQDGVWRIQSREGEFTAGAVILATGTALRELGIPGEERLRGKGVSHCASCDAPLLRDKPVVVVGGGDSAAQEALTLAQAASKVTILALGEALTAQATFLARIAENPKIEVRTGAEMDEILGADGVEGVRFQASGGMEELAAAGVFVYVGLTPNTAFLEGLLELAPTGHIPTDANLRTALPGVLAAGTVRTGAPGRAAASAGDGTGAAIAAGDYLTDGGWCGNEQATKGAIAHAAGDS
jgi:thioredoxin reductase (NADPH)